ncbi:MAG: hypothetical protein PHE83_05695 [Opitutaceae bacterium]|nr:hypothetical protein [Opitutaceae bacterium]
MVQGTAQDRMALAGGRGFAVAASCDADRSLGAPAAPLDIARLLAAVAAKETGLRWDGRPGPGGELSAWQITETVWRQHCKAPFAQAATDHQLAREVAERHIHWLIAQIERRGLPVTPQRVATAWHFGLSHVARRTPWGREVANLYHDLP